MALSNDTRNGNDETFSLDERAAMRERAKELKAAQKNGETEDMLLEKVAEMPQPDKGMAEKLHKIMKEVAPSLIPKTWYGMPAYTNKDGKVVCFFQGASKFNARYATLGFNDAASLDDGPMWPTSFAMKELGAAEEARIRDLVKKAVS